LTTINQRQQERQPEAEKSGKTGLAGFGLQVKKQLSTRREHSSVEVDRQFRHTGYDANVCMRGGWKPAPQPYNYELFTP
jgi:hypothetical protein